jgi:hypothetical protein
LSKRRRLAVAGAEYRSEVRAALALDWRITASMTIATGVAEAIEARSSDPFA